jgi:hypothetical protein
MNKKVIGVVIVVVVLVGGYMLMKRTPAPGSDAMKHDGMMMDGSPHSGAMSASEILKSGKDQKCTFTRKDANVESTGTVYFSKGKMHGEFDVAAQGQSFKASMTSDGTDVYTWSSMMPQGVKTAVRSGAENDPNNQSYDLDDMMDYDCTSWKADQAVFELPKDIKFMEVKADAMVTPPAASTDAAAMKAQQCASCELLTDATQKTQCKAAFSCK